MSDTSQSVLRIYRKAAELYERVASSLGDAALGYEVLYGPPISTPPVLFVGYQPGGDKLEPLPRLTETGEPPPWPATVDYATAAGPDRAARPFKLALRLQVAFGAEFLGRCTGLNAIFLRSPTMDTYGATVPAETRAEYETLGTKAVSKVVELLQPRMIVALGFATMKLFAPSTCVVLRGASDRALLSAADLGGIRLYGMRHPTGSRPPPSDAEMGQIGGYLLQQLGSAG